MKAKENVDSFKHFLRNFFFSFFAMIKVFKPFLLTPIILECEKNSMFLVHFNLSLYWSAKKLVTLVS